MKPVPDLLYHRIDSPLGPLTLAGTGDALLYLQFSDTNPTVPQSAGWKLDPNRFEHEVAQLVDYFAGKRKTFNIKLDLRGSDYNLKVWNELLHIPFGDVITYGTLAERIGQPAGAQAVGNANGQNPVPIIVPCHRVIAARNNIGGFTGGIDKKQLLLRLEKAKNVQFDLF